VPSAVVLDIDKGKECLVELIKGSDSGCLYLGDEVGHAKPVEGLNFAVSFRPVGFSINGLVDVKLGANQTHMVGSVDFSVVIINAHGFSIALQGSFEDKFKRRQVAFKKETAIEQKP